MDGGCDLQRGINRKGTRKREFPDVAGRGAIGLSLGLRRSLLAAGPAAPGIARCLSHLLITVIRGNDLLPALAACRSSAGVGLR